MKGESTMIGLTEREDSLLRLGIDAGATEGEARAAGGRLIALLRARRYNAFQTRTPNGAAAGATITQLQQRIQALEGGGGVPGPDGRIAGPDDRGTAD